MLHLFVRKACFIELNMSRYYDFSCLDVQASVPSMVMRISKKDARRGAMGEFIFGAVVLVWIAKRTEHT